MMDRSNGQAEVGQLDPAAPSDNLGVADHGSRRLILAGIIAGLLLWVLALPLLGDPRISYRMTQVEGDGPPILVARTSFALAADTDMTPLIQPRRPNMAPSTYAQAKAVRPLIWAMETPGVAEALEIEDKVMRIISTQQLADLTSRSVVAQPTSSKDTDPTAVPGTQDEQVVAGSPGPVPDNSTTFSPSYRFSREISFSYPEHLIPGGAPTASLAQILNPTEQPMRGELLPVVLEGDTRLCGGLRTAVVSMEKGTPPRLLTGGSLLEILQGPTANLILEPGKRYDLAVLVSLPLHASNQYQGGSCTVNFMMQFQEV